MVSSRVAAALGKGDFIPNRPGSLSLGYDLWARHENGDVILHCGGNAGWFDWFRPVQDGDTPDFTLAIAGRAYCLVRGVDLDHLPAGFEPVSAAGHLPGRPLRRTFIHEAHGASE